MRARQRGRDPGEQRFPADAAGIIARIRSFIRRSRCRIWLPFSNGHAKLLVAALPVLALAALTTVRDELTAGTVLKHSTVAWNAAVGALLGREGVFLRSHHNASDTGTAPLTPHCDVTVTEHDSRIQTIHV